MLTQFALATATNGMHLATIGGDFLAAMFSPTATPNNFKLLITRINMQLDLTN